MSKIINIVLILAFTIFSLLLIPSGSRVYAAVSDDIKQGACGATGQASCTSGDATKSINDTITSFINIISVIAGILAVIMILFAGFKYITSAGNEQTVANAKRTLIYAVIGLIIAALAQVIVRFVLKQVTTDTAIAPSTSQNGGTNAGGNQSGQCIPGRPGIQC